jgi:hypothetical protein
MATYKLHRWAVVCSYDDPYLAPEANPKCLTGFRDEETKEVITSPIVKMNGREMTTYSGSLYILEDVSPEYLQWMDDNGFEMDPNNPINVVKKIIPIK